MNTRSAAPVFQVANVDVALKHYKEVLGFEDDFRVGDYARVKLGKVSVHLTKHGDGEFAKPIGGGIVYIFCDEVDSYFAKVETAGARVKYPPKDWPYGMREFMLADPDGNHLAFGCESKRA